MSEIPFSFFLLPVTLRSLLRAIVPNVSSTTGSLRSVRGGGGVYFKTSPVFHPLVREHLRLPSVGQHEEGGRGANKNAVNWPIRRPDIVYCQWQRSTGRFLTAGNDSGAPPPPPRVGDLPVAYKY